MRFERHKYAGTVAGSLRFSMRLLSPLNDKSPKGEKLGFLQAMLYLAPATLAGGKTMCPASTEACRAGCLFHAGRGAFKPVINARIRRTRLYLEDRDAFFDELIGELVQMQDAADAHGMTLAVRLNGLSDLPWEREIIDGRTLFEMFERAVFFDYTRLAPRHRRVPPNWSLTYSVADDPPERALEHLRAGRNVAVVVPEAEKLPDKVVVLIGGVPVHMVDGDLHDLRLLDPSPAIVQLKPKGPLRRGGPMVRGDFINQLHAAAKETA